MMPFLAVVLAYFIGAIPVGYLLVKWRTGSDVRAAGSGNIGATNVLRTAGKASGVATLLLDIAKGYIAVWIAERASQNSPAWMSLAAIAVMAGHAFPIFLGFKGGKAVACFIGAFLRLTPLPMSAALVVFAGLVAWTRHISIGSIIAAGTFPLAVWLLLQPPLSVEVASVAAAAIIIYRHKANIERLRRGKEHVLSWGGPRP
ncbi:MAG: glycerol-3-phosphate 1-O-acyltransferase PlsY [Acidobacteriia bacterium]|nr:glycerol-3-phosphate 1-O-acyltransferase PlsY [Terriglobia bacterium]